MPWGQGQEMTLTFNTHILSSIQLDVWFFQLSGHWLQKFLKNQLFSLFPAEKPVTKFDLAVNKVKVTPGSSFVNYDGQESPMLHTKFRGNRPAGFREEDF